MKTLKLTKGYTAFVNNADFPEVSKYKWQACVTPRTVYAYRSTYVAGKRRKVYLHRSLLRVENSKIGVDHKDHNGLNCTRRNLRVATKAQNARNARKSKSNTSGFKGVSPSRGRWLVHIQGKHIGRFSDKAKAVLAYTKAAKLKFGKFWCAK